MAGHIIVLEGPDGVGKTSLADAIQAEHIGPSVRFSQGPPPDDTMAALHYWDGALEMVKAAEAGNLVIADRFHVGELVYGPLLRGFSGITVDEASAIDLLLVANGATLVHCALPVEQAKARMVARDGGVDDPKSGAKLAHANVLRASFQHKLGAPGRPGALPGRWMYLSMDGYPAQLAKQVMLQASTMAMFQRLGHGWWGDVSGKDTVLVMPDEDCFSIQHLAWVAKTLRAVGYLGRTAAIFPSTHEIVELDVEGCSIIALGRGVEWADQNGLRYDLSCKHYDEMHGFDTLTELLDYLTKPSET